MIEANDNTRNEELQRALDDYSRQREGVGLGAAVILPDGTAWSGVSGYASQERACLLTLDHHLYIGSMTKLYTAALVMDQVERGTISLQDTLDRWVDLDYANTITVEMLLNHTSGIPSYTENLWFLIRYFWFPEKQWQTDELIAVIQNKGLKFEPGSRQEYSNSNYLLLGMILEKVTGDSYGTLLWELIEQLGLQDTYYFARPADLLIANGYDESLLHLGKRNLTGFRKSLETGAFSAGGILSTSGDTASFVHSLFNGQIVNNATVTQMKRFVEAPDKDVPLQTGYGLGIRNMVIDGENLVGHTGTIPGYSGIAMHNEHRRYTIVILSNLSVIEQTQLFTTLQSIVLSETP
jgi:D-alanyl-D-alanine carboxypeptidase